MCLSGTPVITNLYVITYKETPDDAHAKVSANVPDPRMCLGLGAHHQTNAACHVAGSDPSTNRT